MSPNQLLRADRRAHYAPLCTAALVAALTLSIAAPHAAAQLVNRPVITEVYTDPIGATDGPVARDPASANQEFIEIYLPQTLAAGLNADALRLTFYEVEGDSTSSGLGLVNYRFDLPTFDLDPSNGITPGAIERPPSGVVVLGWVDYVGNPPADLAGTPSTRVALINGGVTSTTDFTFIAINGHHFSGTTNFPTLTAESLIDLPNEATSGVVQNGSGAYLLVNRDAAGYAELFDDQNVPPGRSANPDLPSGAVLGTDALMDGFASNDHGKFRIDRQPYDPPTGDDIDLETVLPRRGAFSNLVAQVPERIGTRPNQGRANGYARLYADVPKTTDDASAGNDDPVADAMDAYRHVRNDGPFFPSPGRAALTTSPPELGVAAIAEQSFMVLSQTTGRPAVLSANVGGDFPIDMTVSGAASSNASVATFSAGDADLGVPGQMFGLPTLTITAAAGASDGQFASASPTVTATNSNAADPPVVNGVQAADVSATVIAPTTGLDANGAAFQATVFAAMQPVPADPAVLNEFLGTDLGAFVSANLGAGAQDTSGNGALLTNPATDLSDPLTVLPMVKEFPSEFFLFARPPSPPGRLDLAETVLLSAEVQSGARTYDESLDPNQTAVRAIRMNVPDTTTFGGSFSATERMHFADPGGTIGEVRSGLTNATTSRTFEAVLLDINLRFNGTYESGATDDVGIVVEVLDVEPGSPVVPGEFVFLSFTGGLQGADLDGFADPAGRDIAVNLIFLDLDNLHDVLGVRSIESFWLIDAESTSEAEFIEAFSLNPITGGVLPPVINPIPNDASLCGNAYSGPTPTLTNPAAMAPVTWSLVSGPSGMTIDSVSGVVSWSTPTLGAHPIAIRATNTAGFDDEPWTLTVNPNIPTITGQPGDQTACEGDPVTFSVIANGVAPLGYQWRKDGANIAGATNPSYSIAAAATADAGSYDVIVSSPCGSTTSIAAALTVDAPPRITAQPGDRAVCEGDPVTFSVTANGAAPLSYQWRKDSANIAGATNPSYSIAAAAIGDGGSYDVVVSNPCGSATSIAATLTVDLPPTITTQPQSQTVTSGATATFSVSATGATPITYQWRLNGVNLADGPAAGGGTISGATTATLMITQAASADQGTYDVVVSNTCGAATSTGATLTVSTPCPGDLDGDLDVDLADLAVILSNFGTPFGALPEDGDLDGDGDVDLTDLAVMLSNFGTTCP